MADWDNQHRRWAELMDRQALGETLSAEELELCERLGSEHEACRREVELLDELADLEVAPSPESRALVDAALARLADEAARAENAELSELKRGPRVPRFLWLSGAGALAAVAAVALLLPHKPSTEPSAGAQPMPGPRVELVYASGEVRVDGKPVALGLTSLAEGSVIEVGHGAACMAMDPEISVCASEQTRLKLSRTHSAWRRLDLESGKVATQLAPQPEGYRLSVVADGVWSTAVGTAFTVERDGAQGVRTAVLNGKVRVGSDGGAEQMVAAHERSQVLAGQAKLASISRTEEAPEWALLRPSRLWSNPVTASLTLRGLPAGTEVSLDGHVIGLAPLTSLIPAGAHRLEARANGQLTVTRDFVCEAGQQTALSFTMAELTLPAAEPQIEPSASPKPTATRAVSVRRPVEVQATERPVQTVVSASDMLAQARQLMRAERFEQAASAYQLLRLAYPESPEARAVLVSLAEVQLDRLAQVQPALGNLEQYLKGGNGALVEEARRVRIRALQAIGDSARERSAIEEFLQAHPKSFQASALERRLSELKARP
jgi:hypothetical protein